MTWLKALTWFLSALEKLFDFIGNKQLLDAGEAKAEAKQAEIGDVARETARKTKEDVANLSDDDLVAGMREYEK